MPDKVSSIESLGIEHVPEEQRHGTSKRTFTLWFAANLTIADYVIGVLSTVYFGFTVAEALPILLVGNLLGGLLLGLAASMGPKLGFPQMLSSRSSFGRKGNYLTGGFNWVSTAGWFTVNTVLAVLALQVVLPSANFVAAAALYVGIQAIIALYGHDFIHLFEKLMAVVLGLMFLLLFALAYPRLGEAFSYVPAGHVVPIALGSLSLLFVASFSYLMSWSPYASDYSRYLPVKTSKRQVGLLALAGGAISSFGVEAVGAVVGSLTPAQTVTRGYFGGLYFFAGWLGPVAMLTLILGAFAADALNLYTNSLSALVLDVRTKRWKTVAAGGVVSLALAVIVGNQFELFFEDFLLILSYWIMPWLAIVLVDFFIVRKTTVTSVEEARSWDRAVLAVYGSSILVSLPFMNLTGYSIPFQGPVSSILGGADFSYFVSFFVAAALVLVARRTGSQKARAVPNSSS